jgi:hypothetical protein
MQLHLTTARLRTAASGQQKMLHNVLNGCFGEAATQRLDLWPTAGVGRSQHTFDSTRIDLA